MHISELRFTKCYAFIDSLHGLCYLFLTIFDNNNNNKTTLVAHH